jgi:hypothetical protein
MIVIIIRQKPMDQQYIKKDLIKTSLVSMMMTMINDFFTNLEPSD